ncbi:uncharacterized protein LOC115759293 [Drosophila novamexicana]|uniref:uncharacterized protein LOC115759293 n=1 Tax=Drosophila novamexicana TaxID=47314 RepID=UPI0011E5FB3A|nr:uncharacterized protein LOC115759293 [Drosophila novamexicana]
MSYISYRHFNGRTIAFTDDNVEVKKLFLQRVPFKMHTETLQTYFSYFGKVLHVELIEKPRKKKFKFGYVLFESSRDAADVLLKEMHLINDRLIKLEPYHSWGQPAVENIEPIPEESPIRRLNDDCLYRIYRYLSLTDQLNLARALKRCPPLYSSINLGTFKSISLWDMHDFFVLFGYKLNQIVGQIPRNRYRRLIEFVSTHCHNLRVLRITNSPLTVCNTYKLVGHLHQLQELKLSNCDLVDDCLPSLTGLHKLKKLDLCYNDMLTGLLMDKLPSSIESLNLLYCIDVESMFLPRICSALPQLKELGIRTLLTEHTNVFQELANGHCCDKLETITLQTEASFHLQFHLEYLAKLPGLKKLIMYERPTLMLLQWLVEHKSEQLIHLENNSRMSLDAQQMALVAQLNALRILALPNNIDIDDDVMGKLCNLQHLEVIHLQGCKKITDQAVLRLLLSCSKLHVLHLERCRLLSGQLIHCIIGELRELCRLQLNHRQLPVKLYFFGAKFNDFMLKHSDVRAASDMVDIELTRCPYW